MCVCDACVLCVYAGLSRPSEHTASQLGGGLDGAELELLAVLFEDGLVVELPKGLAGVLAAEAGEDLDAAGVLVLEGWGSRVRGKGEP